MAQKPSIEADKFFVRNRIGPYLEQQILAANPLELIHLYYQTTIQAVRDARNFLGQDNIPERVRCISLAHGALAELYNGLDFKKGGEIARELGRLYDFMMRRLIEANAKKSDAPLAEVLNLLCTLTEAWEQVAKSSAPVAAPTVAYGAQPWGSIPMEESSYSLTF